MRARAVVCCVSSVSKKM